VGIFYDSIDIYKEMKNLIRKILKEQENEFDWVKDINPSEAEKLVIQPFRDMDYEYSTDFVSEMVPLLIEKGITRPEDLTEIGREIKKEFSRSYYRAYDSGYDSGQNDCGCDYCCDDMYYIDDVREKEKEAREEGYEEGQETGYEAGKSEMQDKIEELEEQIEELQARLAGSNDDLN